MQNQQQEIIQYIDLTNLEMDLNEEDLISLCNKANNPAFSTAAVCVQNKYVKFCKDYLHGTDIKVASVFNFPFGDNSLDKIMENIAISLDEGVDELDIVIPIKQLQENDDSSKLYSVIYDFVSNIRSHVLSNVLKFIISTDVLKNDAKIRDASKAVIEGGGDFIKTCTGKTGGGCTLHDAKTILEVIQQSDKKVGFKASGGISTPEFALEIFNAAKKIYGNDISPKYFRIGASGLLDKLVVQY